MAKRWVDPIGLSPVEEVKRLFEGTPCPEIRHVETWHKAFELVIEHLKRNEELRSVTPTTNV